MGAAHKGAAGLLPALGWCNGELALIFRDDDRRPVGVAILSLAPDERIARVQVVLNPDKLRGFA